MRRLSSYEDPENLLEKEPFFRMLMEMGLMPQKVGEREFGKMEVGASGPKLPSVSSLAFSLKIPYEVDGVGARNLTAG